MRSLKEIYLGFFQDPSRESLRDLLRSHTGEVDECDFKAEWPRVEYLAKTSVAFANMGSGMLVIGVKESEDGTLDPIGLVSLRDKTEVLESFKKYTPPSVTCEIFDFEYTASDYEKLKGRKYQILSVSADLAHAPYATMREGENIKRGKIYIRRNISTVEAEYDDLMAIITRRLSADSISGRHDLRKHLEDLRILYEYKSGDIENRGYFARSSVSAMLRMYTAIEQSQSFSDVIDKLIAQKIKIIEGILAD